MNEWLKVSALLCAFGFVREIRPSEPYITEFLSGPWRNFTLYEVNREVYPIGTYSYLAQLVVVFLITDFLRYKPLIVATGVTGVIVWSIMIWTKSLPALQVSQFFYGTYMSTDVAYYTYIYAKVDKKYYPRVTSYTRAAAFAGKLVSGITSQVLVNLHAMNYFQLNYITLGTQAFATIWALFLPKVKKSLYFHREDYLRDTRTTVNNVSTVMPYTNGSDVGDSVGEVKNAEDIQSQRNNQMREHHVAFQPFQLLWSHFCNAYTNLKVVQWSIWYAVSLGGYLQVISYMQVMWKDIEPEPYIAWNGAVDAVLTVLAICTALSAGYLHAGRLTPHASLLIVSALAMVEGGFILISSWTTNIYVSYTGYILFAALYAFTITVASAEVARHLEEDSYGLVFGINTLVGLILQTLLTVIVVSRSGFALSAKGQYTVYSAYFIIIGFMYFLAVVLGYFRSRRSASTTHLMTQ